MLNLPSTHIRFASLRFFSLFCLSLFISSSAKASFYVSINSIGYTGIWQKFDSLSDAQSNINEVDSGTVPQRDLQLYLSQGSTSPDGFQMVTGWNLGAGNPSNTNNGFLQITDLGSTTVDSSSVGWTDSSFTTYQINLTGSNAQRRLSPTEGNQETRLGVGPSDRSTNGNWLSYDLSLNFGGLSSSETDPGIQTAVDEPSSVAGSLFVLFENPNLTDLDANPNANLGFYRVGLTINEISWAEDNNVPAVIDDTSTFEAPTTPVPEASTFAVVLSLLACLRVAAPRRHRK